MRCLLAAGLVLAAALASACTVGERTPRPPAHGAAPPVAPGPQSGGPLPGGIYSVHEIVAVDTCHPSHSLPPQVSVLKRRENGVGHLIVPVPSFGLNGRSIERISVHPQGFKGSGMAHPKVCPGMQQTYEQELVDVTPTSFRIEIEYDVADAWDCPNARSGPMCRTRLSYEYRLVQAACPAHCDARVAGQRDEQVPPEPVQQSCVCP